MAQLAGFKPPYFVLNQKCVHTYDITIGVAEKKGVVGPQLYADYAVLDGDLTLSLPPKVSSFYLLSNVKLYVQKTRLILTDS